jgi:hypothetical protein
LALNEVAEGQGIVVAVLRKGNFIGMAGVVMTLYF